MFPLHHQIIAICNTIIFISGKLHHKPFIVKEQWPKSLWLWCHTEAPKSSGTSGPLNFHHHCWVAVWVSRVIVTPSQLVFPSFSPKPHHGGSIGGDAHNFEGILSPWLLWWWWWWLQCEGGHIYSHGNCIDDKNVCDRNPREDDGTNLGTMLMARWRESCFVLFSRCHHSWS